MSTNEVSVEEIFKDCRYRYWTPSGKALCCRGSVVERCIDWPNCAKYDLLFGALWTDYDAGEKLFAFPKDGFASDP